MTIDPVMTMKITIFEKEHFEGAYPVIRLLDQPGRDITIITSAATQRRFADLLGDQTGKFGWQILPEKNRLSYFLSLLRSIRQNKPDILYINTISDNHLLYALVLWLARPKRVVLTVHDINCLFESNPRGGFRGRVIHTGKRWLIKQVDEFNTVSDTMTAYLSTKARGKPLHVVPGAVFEGRSVPQQITGRIRLVIPGSLDQRRRNYEEVFQLAAMLNEQRLPCDLVLLGGYHDAYGKSVMERAVAFEPGTCRLVAYQTAIVDQDEFDRQMDAAHFVFIPSVIHTRICGTIPETYGITKSSGNIFDVVKHAKPFIVPAGLTITAFLQSSCFRYHHLKEIAALLRQLIAAPGDYETWQHEALLNSGKYSPEKVRQRNSSLFGTEQ